MKLTLIDRRTDKLVTIAMETDHEDSGILLAHVKLLSEYN